MNALGLSGRLVAGLLNGARMPSTAEELCADSRRAALLEAEDLRCGLDCLSVMRQC